MQAAKMQSSFTSGELDPKLVRQDIKHYFNGAETLRGVKVLPEGGVTLIPGMEFVQECLKVLAIWAPSSATAPNGGTAANGYDDDETTAVVCTTGISTTDDYVVLRLDLGASKDIEFIDVVGLFVNTGSGVTDEFFIETSPDDAVWTAYGAAIPLTTDKRNRRRTSSVSARYVRLVRNGTTDLGAAVPSVDELQCWYQTSTLSEGIIVDHEFNVDQRYLIVFTDRNARVYKDFVFQADMRIPHTSSELSLIDWEVELDTAFLTHEDVPPQELQRQGSHTEWQCRDVAFTTVPNHAFDLVESNPSATLTPSAVSGAVTLTAGSSIWSSASVNQIVHGNGGRARIVEYVSGTVVKGVTIIPFYNTTAIASGNWTLESGYEAMWSATRGYPVSVCLYQQRLVFGGTRDRPGTIMLSRTALPRDFDVGNAYTDDAIVYDIDGLPTIANVFNGRHLQIFTSAGELWVPKLTTEGTTPNNFQVNEGTGRGTYKGLRIFEVSGASFFIQAHGSALREYIFSDAEQSYIATNLSLLSGHLLNTPTGIALRKATGEDDADLLLVVNTDGSLPVLSTVRDQEVTAWSRKENTNGLFKAVGTIGEDAGFIIERTINGVAKRFFEKWNNDLLLDGAYYESISSPVSSVSSGIDHFEGHTVRVILDGAVQPDQVVTSGTVTFVRDAESEIQIGLWEAPTILPMPFAVEHPSGIKISRKSKINKIELELLDTTNIVVGGQRVNFVQLPFVLGTVPAPYTGRKTLGPYLGWAKKSQKAITQDAPGNLTLLGLEILGSV